MDEAPIALLLADGTLLTGEDFVPVEGREGVLRCTRPAISLRATITSEPAHGGMVHQLSIQNTSFGRIRLARISPLSLIGDDAAPEGLEGVAIWIQGLLMASPIFGHRFATGETHADLPGAWLQESDGKRTFASAWMTVSGDPTDDQHTLLGFITTDRQLADVRLTTDANEQRPLRLDCGCELNGWTLGPGESLASEKLLVLGPGRAEDLAEQYAGATAAEMQARVPAQIPTGWCSWYFFSNRVSEADVHANLDALVAQGRPVEVVQIDDGFQAATGDWLTPNERFPSGMAALAARIDAAGFTPGLWLAPFVMHRDSRVLAEHPEWAVHDPEGAIIFVTMWLGKVAVLDCSHPGAQEWLRNVFRTATHDWGYRYLKLDALAFACQRRARYHVANTTPAGNLRRGLEIAREGAGNQTFILGCTCPFGPAIGLVDAMRVGPDVRELWSNDQHPSVRHAMRLALPRAYMHRRYWLNDPDCLIVRDNNSTLTEEEARFLASGVALSGGLVMLGDDLASLSEHRLSIARAILPPIGLAARPLDVLTRETPTTYTVDLQRGDDAWTLAGVFNFGDEPAEVEIDLAALGLEGQVHAFEFWEQHYVGRVRGALPIRQLPPHAARIYALRPARDALQLLSVSEHISQGAAQLDSIAWSGAQTLHLRLAERWSRPVRAWLRLPAGASGLEVQPRGLSLQSASGLVAVSLDPAVSRDWTLRAV